MSDPVEFINDEWFEERGRTPTPDEVERIGYAGPGWYFWTEAWVDAIGPYETRGEAVESLDRYCRDVLGHGPTEPAGA